MQKFDIRAAMHTQAPNHAHVDLHLLLQVAIHAIGDKAIDETLAAYARARNQQLPGADCPNLQHRIEHAEHLSSAATIEQFKQLGVFAMGNPIHITYDRLNVRNQLGDRRSGPGQTYAYKSMLQASFHARCCSQSLLFFIVMTMTIGSHI